MTRQEKRAARVEMLRARADGRRVVFCNGEILTLADLARAYGMTAVLTPVTMKADAQGDPQAR